MIARLQARGTNLAFYVEPPAECCPPCTLAALANTDTRLLGDLVSAFRDDMMRRLAHVRFALRVQYM
jgi:hypothetical protein